MERPLAREHVEREEGVGAAADHARFLRADVHRERAADTVLESVGADGVPEHEVGAVSVQQRAGHEERVVRDSMPVRRAGGSRVGRGMVTVDTRAFYSRAFV